MKAPKIWLLAIAAVLAVTHVCAADIGPSNVIIANGTISSLGGGAGDDQRVPPNMRRGEDAVIAHLDKIEVLFGDYNGIHATVVLPMFDAPSVGTKITFIATKKDNKIFQIFGWSRIDLPLCLTDKDIKDFQLADVITHSRFAVLNPKCGWEIRQSSGYYATP